MIEISEELEWTREYIAAARRIIPNINNLTKIVARKPRIYDKSIQRTVGLCSIYRGKYSISIQTRRKVHELDGTYKVRHFTRIELLCTLAHELAHLLDLDHTPDHKELECRITGIFMRKLKKEGYKSEEVEEKLLPRRITTGVKNE